MKLPKSLAEEIDIRRELIAEEAENKRLLSGDKGLYLILTEIEESEEIPYNWLRWIRIWMISRGVYVEITNEALAEMTVLGCAKSKLYFQIKGKKYIFEKNLS